MAEINTEIRGPAWSMMRPQIVLVSVGNTFSLPAVTMDFRSFTFLGSPNLLWSPGISSPSSKVSDATLPTIPVILSALGWKAFISDVACATSRR